MEACGCVSGTTPERMPLTASRTKSKFIRRTTFPPNGMPVVDLNYERTMAAQPGSDSQILFDVPADGRYIVRVRDVRNLMRRFLLSPSSGRGRDFRISLDLGIECPRVAACRDSQPRSSRRLMAPPFVSGLPQHYSYERKWSRPFNAVLTFLPIECR